MTIRSEKEITEFYHLYDLCWSGAQDVITEIIKQGKEDELMSLLEELFPEGCTDIELNDFIWFDVERPEFLNLYPSENDEDE